MPRKQSKNKSKTEKQAQKKWGVQVAAVETHTGHFGGSGKGVSISIGKGAMKGPSQN